jgi:hypothetical protein
MNDLFSRYSKKNIDVWVEYKGVRYCPYCLNHPTHTERSMTITNPIVEKFKCGCGKIEDCKKLISEKERQNIIRTKLIDDILK